MKYQITDQYGIQVPNELLPSTWNVPLGVISLDSRQYFPHEVTLSGIPFYLDNLFGNRGVGIMYFETSIEIEHDRVKVQTLDDDPHYIPLEEFYYISIVFYILVKRYVEKNNQIVKPKDWHLVEESLFKIKQGLPEIYLKAENFIKNLPSEIF